MKAPKKSARELALSGINLSPYWFDGEKTGQELASAIAQTVDGIVADTFGMRHEATLAAALYNNVRPSVVTLEPSRIGSQWMNTSGLGPGYGLSLNVSKSCVDTLMAKLGKEKPRVRFVTDAGDDALQQKARRLTRYMDGIFSKEKVYKEAKKVLKSCIVYGTGAFKVYQDAGGVHVESVPINEVFVDRQDGLYGRPTEIHQRVEASRLQLQYDYPDKADELAGESEIVWPRGTGAHPDKVHVTESWKLPSSPGANDGRHVISTAKVVLLDETWDRPRFPFIFLRWDSSALADFFTPGLVKELAPQQVLINNLLKSFVQAIKTFAVSKLFIDNNTQVGPGEFNDLIGAVVRYSSMGGNAPQVQTPQMVITPQAFDLMWQIYGKCYEISGISQDAAAGKRTEGLTSGAAIRENSDLASERFSSLSMDFEDMFLELAEAIIDESKRFHGANDKVNLTGRGHVETIRWKDVDMDRDKFNLSMFRSSNLPTLPSARLAWIQEMAQAGMIDRDTLMDLLDMPDVSQAELLLSAPYRAAFHMVDTIINDGQYIAPSKYDKLDTCLQLALRTRADMTTWQEPDLDKLALLEQFIDECQMMIMAQQQTAQPPAPEGAAIPDGQVAKLPTAA